MPKSMRRVIIESPYAGEVERNIAYARLALLDCMRKGEAPIASHLLITQVYDDLIPEERTQGISAGLAWYHASDVTGVIYTDLGYSGGMKKAREYLETHGIPFEERSAVTMPEFEEFSEKYLRGDSDLVQQHILNMLTKQPLSPRGIEMCGPFSQRVNRIAFQSLHDQGRVRLDGKLNVVPTGV